MALPKITTPLLPITLPITGEEITVRQFLTKEYKAIMSAYNSSNIGVFIKTVSSIINDCVVKPEDFDASKYHSYTIDYIFLQLYAMSVSGVIDVSVTCNAMVEKPIVETDELGFVKETEETEMTECGTTYNLQIAAKDVQISEIHDGVFKITDDVIVKMEYPQWETWRKISEDQMPSMNLSSDDELTEEDFVRNQEEFAIIAYNCVKEIWTGDEKWDADYSLEEFKEWMDTFPPEKLEEIIGFIQNTPQLYYRKDITCPKCGNEGTINMVGLESFLK